MTVSSDQAEVRQVSRELALLNNNMREMRDELRSALDQRVTHTEFEGFRQIMDHKIKGLIRELQEMKSVEAKKKDNQSLLVRGLWLAVAGTFINLVVSLFSGGLPGS